MTGDDHGNGGTAGQFNRFKARQPSGLLGRRLGVRPGDVVRLPGHLRSPAPKASRPSGFEIALHLSTGCAQLHPRRRCATLERPAARRSATRVPDPRCAGRPTARTASRGATGRASPSSSWRTASGSTRTTTTGPRRLVNDRPGMFTGSGMPMRFADLDGSMIDVYQAATQLTDESGIDYAAHIEALLDGALGAAGLLRRLHGEHAHGLAAARRRATRSWPRRRQRGVPVVSARQMLDWLDGRNGSSFGDLAFSGNRLRFSIQRGGAGATGCRRCSRSPDPRASSRASPAAARRSRRHARTVKGIDYAVFDAAAGDYAATYGTAPPVPPPPDTTITAFSGERELGARRLHVQRVRRAVRVPPRRRRRSAPAPAAAATPASPAVSTPSRCGRSTRRAPPTRPPPSARSPCCPTAAARRRPPPPEASRRRPRATAPTPAAGAALGGTASPAPIAWRRGSSVRPRRARVSADGCRRAARDAARRASCAAGCGCACGSGASTWRPGRCPGGRRHGAFRLRLRRAARRQLAIARARCGSPQSPPPAMRRATRSRSRTAVRLLAPRRR